MLGYGSLALTDNLTMLYTRRYLHETAQAEARRSEARGRPFCVVLAELTEIGRTNSREGYAAGDEEIRAAARGVQRVAARAGGTACRHGGRRLALVAPDADEGPPSHRRGRRRARRGPARARRKRRLAPRRRRRIRARPRQGRPRLTSGSRWKPTDNTHPRT